MSLFSKLFRRKEKPGRPAPAPPLETAWLYATDSSWVHSFRQHRDRAGAVSLDVRFKNRRGRITASCRYADASGALFRGMAAAPSKGKYVNQALYHLPYTLL